MKSITEESNFNVSLGLFAIKFWSTWCQPCKMFGPKVDSLDEEFDNIQFLSIDIDQVPELAQKYQVKSLPTLLLIENGKEVDRIEGLQLIGPMRKKIRDLFNSQEQDQDRKVQSMDKKSIG